MDLSFHTEEGVFNCRVAAVFLRDGKVLLTQHEGAKHFYTPGGRIRLGEDTLQALRRELKEELDIDSPEVERLLWVNENFFLTKEAAETFHEYGFYYLVKAPESFGEEDYFEHVEESDGVLRFYWTPIEKLRDMVVYPPFLKTIFENIPETPEHFIFREE